MKIRRRAHPINPTVGTTKPRPGSVGTKRLPTRNRMGSSMEWPLYNAQGEPIDRAAIQAQVAAKTAANRVLEAAADTYKTPSRTEIKVVETKTEILPPKTLSPLQAFKQQYRNAPWFISAKGASNGHDSIYITADNNAKDDEIPTTFQGVQVRITYVRRGAR